MSVRAWLRHPAAGRGVLLAGAIGFLLYAYPGYLTGAAADELIDSRVGEFTDWHSPVLSEIWRWLGYLFSGPAPLLVLQGTLFLAGGYRLLGRVMSPLSAAVSTVAVLWYPPVLAAMAVICPEALLTGMVLAGAALLSCTSRGLHLLGLGVLLLACGLREGASLAVLPVLVILWQPVRAGWRRPAIAVAVWIVLVIGAVGFDRSLVRTASYRKEATLASHDLAGILRFAGRLTEPALVRAMDGVPLVRTTYRPREARTWHLDPAQLTQGPGRLLDPPATDDARRRLVEARWRLARAYPRAYLRHRVLALGQVLGLFRAEPPAPVYAQFTAQPEHRQILGHAASHSRVQRALVEAVAAFCASFPVRPYVYFVLAVILLPLAAIRRDREAATLLASATAYAVALMFVTAQGTPYDVLWMAASTLLAVIILVARGIRGRALPRGQASERETVASEREPSPAPASRHE